MDDKTYLDQIAAFLDAVHKRAADGTTIADLTQATVDAMRLSIALLDAVNSMTGEEKKQEVLKLVGYVFDTYSDVCVPLLAKPVWWMVKPAARVLVVQIASGLVENLLVSVRSQQ